MDFIKNTFNRVRKVYVVFCENKSKEKNFFIALFFIIVIAFFNYFFIATPNQFPVGSIINIKSGQSLSQVAINLKKEHVIKSTFLFKNLVIIFSGEKGAIAGDYYLEKPNNIFDISYRVAKGKSHLSTVRITIPEGYSVNDITNSFDSRFTLFDKNEFKKIAKEGYLFPDTYFFMTNVTAEDVVNMMTNNFERKIKSIQNDIDSSGKSLSDIIKVASIVENEANTTESRKIVAGILWKRLSIGMPLQVDANFKYINGKSTNDLTKEDLSIDSPYNTYKYKGLPPTPISNPGLDSILATLHPTKTNYLYFLTDSKNNIYYAKTFEEHQKNRELYLNK